MNNTIKVIGAVSLIGIGAIVGTSFTGVSNAAESVLIDGVTYSKVDATKASIPQPEVIIDISDAKSALIMFGEQKAYIQSNYDRDMANIQEKINKQTALINGMLQLGIE